MPSTKYDTVLTTLSAAVGSGGTYTASYPSGRTAEDYLGGTDHTISTQSYRTLFATAGEFTLTFGASNITVTNNSGFSMPVGTKVWLNLDRAETTPGTGEESALADVSKMSFMRAIKITLGAPATAVANGFVASQNLTALGVFSSSVTAAAALAAASLAGTADVPRNVVAAWTGTAVITITGTDVDGNVMIESSASGTSLTGKKAFKRVTGISVSADVTALTVGTGVILGLPVFLPDVPDVFREILDGVAATAGTLVAGIVGTQTATTGDVRGTYSPNSAPNGARVFELIAVHRSPSYKGAAQYAG